MLVTVIMAVVNPVTAEEAGHTFAIVAGKGKGATLLCGGFMGRVPLTCHVIGSQFHPVGAPTHPLEIRHWEAEVAAVAIGMGRLTAVIRPCKMHAQIRFILGLTCEGKQIRILETLKSSVYPLSNLPKHNISVKYRKVLKHAFPSKTFQVSRVEQIFKVLEWC